MHTAITAIRDALKWSKSRPRIVVIFKAKSKTTIGSGKRIKSYYFRKTHKLMFNHYLVDGIKEYSWQMPRKIIDTHGCEDAFTGGMLHNEFLYALQHNRL